MAASAGSKQSEAMKARWEQRKRELVAAREELEQRKIITEAGLKSWNDAILAARTIMTEALELIAYAYRSDIERRWKERWPWLENGSE